MILDTDVPDNSPTDRSCADGRLGLVATGAEMLRWLAIVVVVLVVAEVTARSVVSRSTEEIRWYDAAAQQRIELLDDRGDSVDAVFAGTSAAWQAFAPDEFGRATGLDSFNVGLAGAVPTVMGPWLTNEVAPRSTPNLVVWGLTPLDFAPAYGDLQEDAYDTAIETRPGWLAELDRSISSVSTLVASRRILRSPSDLFGSGETQRAADIDGAAAVTGPGGERIDFDVDVSPEGEAIQKSRLAGFEIDHRDVLAITDTIGELQAAGTTVVLVEVPVPDRFLDQLPQRESDRAATHTTLADIGESTGSDVIFMGDVLGDTNFVDDIHVDSDAATQTTRWLADVLIALEDGRVPAGNGGCGTVEVMDDIGFVVPVEACSNAAST